MRQEQCEQGTEVTKYCAYSEKTQQSGFPKVQDILNGGIENYSSCEFSEYKVPGNGEIKLYC